jgi:YD repeat-containing protein
MNRTHVITLALALFAVGAIAQQHPNIERGFAAEKVYQVGDIDAVNTFNGNLTMSIPLSQTYHIGGALSYGLTLHYNSKVWDYEINQPSRSSQVTEGSYTEAYPARASNAGVGWVLSFGRLLGPHHPEVEPEFLNDQRWVYESPDGQQHRLYPSLRPNDPIVQPNPASGVCSSLMGALQSVAYTRDGTYIRMRHFRKCDEFGEWDVRHLEMPDGTVQEFLAVEASADEFRPHRIHDNQQAPPSGEQTNWVQITYGTQEWTITDSLGRTHRARFAPRGDQAFYDKVVESVELQAFDGKVAHWSLSYSLPPATIESGLQRGCSADQLYNESAVAQWRPNVPFLTSLELRDGGPAGTLVQQYAAAYSYRNAGGCEQGTLAQIQLPTNGAMSYDYRVYTLPSDGCGEFRFRQRTPGIRMRKKLAAWNGSVELETLYEPRVFPPPAADAETCSYATQHNFNLGNDILGGERKGFYPAELATNVVTESVYPNGTRTEVRRTRYNYSAWPTPGESFQGYFGDEYGLPFARNRSHGTDGTDTPRAFLSTETCDPAVSTCPATCDFPDSPSCWAPVWTPKRQTYVVWERDPRADGSTGDPSQQMNTSERNGRMKLSRTLFLDDAAQTLRQTANSDFDGLGHFRTTVESHNFGGVLSSRTSTTNYNATISSDPGGSPLTPAMFGRWLLNLWNERTVTEAGTTYKTQACFDSSTGLEKSRRVLRGTTPDSRDIVTYLTRDQRGNVITERVWGGDLTNGSGQLLYPAPTGPLCDPAPATTPAYQASTEYDGPAGYGSILRHSVLGIAYPVVNYEVDIATGLPKKKIESVTGSTTFETTFDYDVMGRPTRVQPQSGPWTQYSYDRIAVTATATTNAQPASSDFLRSKYFFDAFGRLKRTETAMPDGTSTTTIGYDGLGRRTSASEATYGTSPTVFTTFTYDWSGRPLSITTPDNKVTSFAYQGARETMRTAEVDGASSVTYVISDGFGRLVEVREQSNPNGSHASTYYGYDPADRLVSVSASGQPRTFSYDGRGFMSSESHPETGSISYTGFDVFGRAARRAITADTGGAFTQDFAYDALGRLRTLTGGGRLVKELFYDSTSVRNQADPSQFVTRTDFGKLITALRHNYDDAGADTIVREDYTYAEIGRRPSERRTYMESNGQVVQAFTQSFTFDGLGLAGNIDYPVSPNSQGSPYQQSSVGLTWQRGFLTQVGSLAGLGYHPGGMIASIQHGNGVIDRTVPDASGLGRPGEIRFEGWTARDCSAPPSITSQPPSTSIPNGQTATLSVGIGGTGSHTYQWFRGPGTSQLIQGATSPGYTTPALTTTTSYWVRVTNACGSTDSALATVTVHDCSAAPVLTGPASTTIQNGQTATLSVTVSGTGANTYQWYRGTAPSAANEITGAMSASYTTPSLTTTTSYWVRVTNACGVTNSQTATVTVLDCTAVPTITTQPQSQTIVSGQTATLSVTAGGTGAKTYQWFKDNLWTAITGATSSSYTTPALTTTTKYYVIVTNACGSTVSEPATITVICPNIVISNHPQGAEIESGGSRYLCVTAGSGWNLPLTYQWYKNGSPISGATSSCYNTGPLTASATYFVRVSNGCRSVDSYPATVTVVPWKEYAVSFETYYSNFLSATDCGGSSMNAIPGWWPDTCGVFILRDLNGGTLEHGDYVQLRTQNGHWVVAEWGGGDTLNANRTSPAEWETFQISNEWGGGPIQNLQYTNLRSYYGYYVVAEWGGIHGGGNGEVNCNRTSPGAWETFRIRFH